MPEKLERCVREVKASGSADDPWAVCVKSTGLSPHAEEDLGWSFRGVPCDKVTFDKWAKARDAGVCPWCGEAKKAQHGGMDRHLRSCPEKPITGEKMADQAKHGDYVQTPKGKGVVEEVQPDYIVVALNSGDSWRGPVTKVKVMPKPYSGYAASEPIGNTRIEKDRDTGEFIVKAYGVNGQRMPEADYYTNDASDAMATAQAMKKGTAKHADNYPLGHKKDVEPGDTTTTEWDGRQWREVDPNSPPNGPREVEQWDGRMWKLMKKVPYQSHSEVSAFSETGLGLGVNRPGFRKSRIV